MAWDVSLTFQRLISLLSRRESRGPGRVSGRARCPACSKSRTHVGMGVFELHQERMVLVQVTGEKQKQKAVLENSHSAAPRGL